MGNDIMAESQTETVLAALDRGEADDKLRDQVSAALLRALTRISDRLEELKTNLWDMDKLETAIDKRHQVLCSNCVLRQQMLAKPVIPDDHAKKKSWLELILTSESTRYFVLMVILVWAIVYVKSGPEGVANVRQGLTHTVSGNAR